MFCCACFLPSGIRADEDPPPRPPSSISAALLSCSGFQVKTQTARVVSDGGEKAFRGRRMQTGVVVFAGEHTEHSLQAGLKKIQK